MKYTNSSRKEIYVSQRDHSDHAVNLWRKYAYADTLCRGERYDLYNPDGKITDENHYVGDTLQYKFVYEYDASGCLTKQIMYDAGGNNQNYGHDYETDSNGNVTKDTHYDKNGNIDYIYEYDSEGKTTVYISYYDGRDPTTHEYEYDSNGNMIKQNLYDSDGQLWAWYDYVYETYIP